MAEYRVLLVEDNEDDALLIKRALRRTDPPLEILHIETRAALSEALDAGGISAIVTDFNLVGFSGLDVIRIVRNRDPYMPVILVSGAVGEERAVEAIKAGARDYVLKDGLIRLGPALHREIAEVQVLRERDNAERASLVKTQFLSDMSHELRTPLNSILGFSGIMLDGLAGPITEEQHKQLSMIRKAGAHLLNLINDVLDVAKIESGRRQMEVESCSIIKLIDETMDMLEHVAAEKGLSISRPEPPTKDIMHTDGRALKQVLVNLVSNAVKYTESGSVAMRISEPDEFVTFEIEDTGVGIPEEHIEIIFDEFKQLGRARSSGTGLGLAISLRLAHLLGGDLSVRSEHGVGSTFTLRVPRTLPDDAASRLWLYQSPIRQGVEANTAQPDD